MQLGKRYLISIPARYLLNRIRWVTIYTKHFLLLRWLDRRSVILLVIITILYINFPTIHDKVADPIPPLAQSHRMRDNHVKHIQENQTAEMQRQGEETLLPVAQTQSIKDHSKITTQENKHAEIIGGIKRKKRPTRLLLPNVFRRSLNCSKIIAGDEAEIAKAHKYQKEKRLPISASNYIRETQNCTKFKTIRGYINQPLSKAEDDFPIAFSIQMYKDVEQVERLLRLIYRPQNIYCIHIDNKSEAVIHTAMASIANCFPNIFLASFMYDVRWGEFSQTLAEIVCMKDALKYPKWKYFINLTGQEFPLRTNAELVKILTVYNGGNDITGSLRRAIAKRYQFVHKGIIPTNILKTPPPHNITVTKGSLFIAASRGYIDFIIRDQRAIDFLQWCADTANPDETFFSTMNHNPALGVPGSFTGEMNSIENKGSLVRYKRWLYNNTEPCHGKKVRNLCIFGIEDLQSLAKLHHMFLNKFHLDYQPLAFDCMEEWYFDRVYKEVQGKAQPFDLRKYQWLSFVNQHLLPDKSRS